MLYSMYSRHKKNLAARFAPHKQKRQVGDAYISDLSFPSKLREAFPHLLVIELALLRLLQHIHRFRDGGVPLIPTNLLPVLPLLQPVIGAVILHLGRGAVGFALGLLAVSAHLPAGALCLTGSNVAAVAGVISCRQQKIPPAVMAAARRVARSQSPVEFRSQEVRQTVEGSLLRYEDLVLIRLAHHGNEAHLHGEALGEVLAKKMRGHGKHLGIEGRIRLGVGSAVSPLQRLEVFLCHDGDLLAKPHKSTGKTPQADNHPLIDRVAL